MCRAVDQHLGAVLCCYALLPANCVQLDISIDAQMHCACSVCQPPAGAALRGKLLLTSECVALQVANFRVNTLQFEFQDMMSMFVVLSTLVWLWAPPLVLATTRGKANMGRGIPSAHLQLQL